MDTVIFKMEIIAQKWFALITASSVQLGIFLLLIFLIASAFKKQSARFLYFVWLIGLLKILIPPVIKLPAFMSNATFIPDNQIPVVLMPEIYTSAANLPMLSYQGYLFIAWAAIVLILIAYWLYQVIQFRIRMIRSCIDITGRRLFDRKILNGDKVRIFTGPGITTPFTRGVFKPKIYLPESVLSWQENELNALVLHEYAHIKRKDLLFITLQNIVQLLFFFHPLVWLASRQISRYREKACDDFAIHALQGKALEYGKLLLKSIDEAMDWRPIPSMSTYFHHSKKFLFNRFHYILNRKGNIMTKLKLSQKLVLVGLIIFGIVISCQKKEQPTQAEQAILADDVVFNLSKASLQGGLADSQKVDFDMPPMPAGGFEALATYLNFPEFLDKRGNIINVRIDANNAMTNVQYIASSLSKNLTPIETMALNKFNRLLLSEISKLKWTAATKNGRPVSVWLTLPIQYRLKITREEFLASLEVPPPPPPSSGEPAAFFVAYDDPPQPIGGFAAIQENLVYPEIARRAGIEGIVVVQAQIGVNGEVIDTRILQSLGEDNGCDEVAVAAIKAVKWQPAKAKDQPVTVWVSIPVRFKLQGDQSIQKREAVPSGHTDVIEKIEARALTYTPPEIKPDVAAEFFVKFDKPPEPIGGFEKIHRNLVYPELAQKAGIEGTVTVQARIDEKGDVIDTRILVPLKNSECNEAAVAAIKSVKWKPAQADGKPIVAWIAVPVRFRLH